MASNVESSTEKGRTPKQEGYVLAIATNSQQQEEMEKTSKLILEVNIPLKINIHTTNISGKIYLRIFILAFK